MKTKQVLNIILTLLALHLLFSNTNLLIKLTEPHNVLSKIMILLFASSYSAMTVLIISVYPRWYVFSISALFDGFAVWLKYFTLLDSQTFTLFASVYFGLYTGFIVVISGKIAMQYGKDVGVKDKEALRQERLSLVRSLARLSDPVLREQKEKRLREIEAAMREG